MGGGRVILLKNQPAIALLTQEIILLPRRRVAPNVNVVLGWGLGVSTRGSAYARTHATQG